MGAIREKWSTQKGRVRSEPWLFQGFKVVTPASWYLSMPLTWSSCPCLNLAELGDRSVEEAEVWNVVTAPPRDKALCPNGFTVRFLRSTWEVIKADIM
jgi:hypothetical protein